MKHVIIGTAGHVDHGKSSLILALTGRDTDRLAEEKERGITIELGFTWLDLPDGSRSGIIDVPGHERFISNMLAGAGGIDLALLVVAADEGVMPQTREHLGILSLLGIPRGLIAVTKCDLADPELLELVEEDIREQVQGSFLKDAPLIRTSSVSGQGIDDLRAALFEAIQSVEQDPLPLPFRLPIDRVFSLGGFGTIVTGTLIEGSLVIGDKAEVFPGGKAVRIRGIQVHEESVEKAFAGQRVALNLSGVHKDDLARGDSLAAPGSLLGTRLLDVSLTALADTAFPISHHMRVHLFHGAREVLARVVLLDRDILEAGQTGPAQLRTEEEIFTRYGDRFVIRFYSPLETIGGGVIVDPLPARRRRMNEKNDLDFQIMAGSDPAARLALAVDHGGQDLALLDRAAYKAGIHENQRAALTDQLIQEGRIISLTDRTAVSREALDSLGRKASRLLQRFHTDRPLEEGMRREELRTRLMPRTDIQLSDLVVDRLVQQGILDSQKGLVSLAGFSVSLSADQEKAARELEALFIQAAYSPPGLDELSLSDKKIKVDPLVSLLINQGILIRLTPQILMHKDQVQAAWETVERTIEEEEQISLAAFRDHLETSRKFAMALLEYFDRQKKTRLTGEVRVFYS